MIRISDSVETIVKDADIQNNLNVFFGQNYASYCSGGNYLYVYSEYSIMPLIIYEKWCFRWCRFTSEPFTYKQGAETIKGFLNDVCFFLKREKGIHWITITPASSFFLDYPDGAINVPFGSHVINLSLDEETLFSNIHSKHRNVIKKAEKEGVVIESGNSEHLISDYHKIDIQTWERSNRQASGEGSIRNMIEKMKEDVVIYIAYKDGDPQSGAIFFFNKAMCYYMHGANKNNPITGSGNLLQWQAIKDMKAAGVQKYSFVGCRINEDEDSKYHGIQRFKERFGGELIQGFLFKEVFSPFKYRLFNLCISLSSLLKSGRFTRRQADIIDEEIHKWKQLKR